MRATSDAPADPAVPVKVVDGVECTTRAGIAHLAGWKPGNSVNVRAKQDPDFPAPVNGPEARGRVAWYALDAVDRYLAVLADRARAKKPPAVKAGNPDDLLDPDQAADALHIAPATLRSYVRYSRPFWDGEKDGRPLLPAPDEVTVDEHGERRRWSRRTLTAHQQQRPGPGTGAGRPRGTTATA
jgi:hypothetical protein